MKCPCHKSLTLKSILKLLVQVSYLFIKLIEKFCTFLKDISLIFGRHWKSRNFVNLQKNFVVLVRILFISILLKTIENKDYRKFELTKSDVFQIFLTFSDFPNLVATLNKRTQAYLKVVLKFILDIMGKLQNLGDHKL